MSFPAAPTHHLSNILLVGVSGLRDTAKGTRCKVTLFLPPPNFLSKLEKEGKEGRCRKNKNKKHKKRGKTKQNTRKRVVYKLWPPERGTQRQEAALTVQSPAEAGGSRLAGSPLPIWASAYWTGPGGAAPAPTLRSVSQGPAVSVPRPQQHHDRPLPAPGGSDPSRSGPMW